MSKEDVLKIQTCVLKVNIHCDGCQKKVKKILSKIDGVYQSTIDPEEGKFMGGAPAKMPFPAGAPAKDPKSVKFNLPEDGWGDDGGSEFDDEFDEFDDDEDYDDEGFEDDYYDDPKMMMKQMAMPPNAGGGDKKGAGNGGKKGGGGNEIPVQIKGNGNNGGGKKDAGGKQQHQGGNGNGNGGDDVVLFLCPVVQYMAATKMILEIYENASSLKVNLSKSAIIPIRCDDINPHELKDVFPCATMPIPIKYLRLSLSNSRLRKRDYTS
ncbi:hypothetical protein TRIUR3_33633 [Triticum urartu]|uniref:HMA domain-containing protein n=2 Tax=Triticum TaxID=4564 RepID=A0A9R0SEJ6_TRITD|nr:hypothetical protein TRIUR3_33633 [Triticum urartu]VAH92730.1 unnamed protein product [Triticum turgidum subsp. durum]